MKGKRVQYHGFPFKLSCFIDRKLIAKVTTAFFNYYNWSTLFLRKSRRIQRISKDVLSVRARKGSQLPVPLSETDALVRSLLKLYDCVCVRCCKLY